MNLLALAELDPTLDRVAAGVVKRVLARVQKARAYKHVHAAADAQLPAVQALMQAAFARGHAAISREQLVSMISKEDHAGLMIAVDMAITATANALHASDLHEVLLKVLVDSGKTAFNHVKVMRSAGSEDEPRDDHGQWTSGGSATVKKGKTFNEDGNWDVTLSTGEKTKIFYDRASQTWYEDKPTKQQHTSHYSDLWAFNKQELVDKLEERSKLRGAGSEDEPRDDHGQWTSAGLPTRRPDGAPVMEKPAAGSLAEKRGIKKGDTVTYHYRAFGDDMGHDGRGKVIGFAKNAAHIAKMGSIQDVVIHTGGSVKFVAEKNVRGSRLRSAADPSISTDFVFDDTDPAAVEWAKQHAAELVQGISKTSRDDIRQLVEDAFTEHLTADELADEIENVIGDDARAETIARTETMKASNVGQQQAWDQAVEQGLLLGTEQQEWITTPDDKLCPICESLDGQTVGLDESFSDDSGDEYDGPPAHPNCRCTVGLSLEPANAIRAAYNDDQPRDEKGQWAGGGVLYHGTHTGALESIQKEGLRPGGSKGVSAEGSKPDVNLTSDLSYAKLAAGMAEYNNPGTKGVVLEVRIPKSEKTSLARNIGLKTTYHYHGTVKAEHIRVHMRAAAYSDNEPRDDHGKWTGGGSGSTSARAQRALASHKPSTAAVQRHAESNETDVKKMVGGDTTGDNEAMDVVTKIDGKKHGVEVKTLIHNSNDKITMHPPSRRRKEQWSKDNHAVVHTVVLDDRKGRANSGHRIYYKRGVGAFRLHTMTPVKNAAHLRDLMRAK